jgi:hypothetical protein
MPNFGLMSKAECTQAMKSTAKIQLYHDILSLIFGSLVEIQGNEGGLPCQLSTVKRFTMLSCCSSDLLSLGIPTVTIDFVVNTTVVDQVLLAYAITAIPHTVRQTMLTVIGTHPTRTSTKCD